MSLSDDTIQKALRVRKVVKEYFAANTSLTKIQAKELMNLFIEKGIFSENYQDGLPIRTLLRTLKEENNLHLIPQVHFEQKDINTYWFFIRIKDKKIES